MSISALYDRSDAVALGEAVASREVAPAELLEEAIARTERVNPALNAVTSRLYELAGERALRDFAGPFPGVPFFAKDLGPALSGAPLTMGSRYFDDYVPEDDHELFRRMKASGLNIFAKTSAPEFGLLPYTEPRLFGPCRNPWDTSRTPGGSSGGSAAVVAAGVVPMAHANDMGGSIRIPASCCGLFGMKPTRGRAPTTGGIIGEANVDLAVSRSVRDSATLLDAIAYVDPDCARAAASDSRPLRIAVVRGPMLGHGISAEARAALDDAVQLCESLGHTLVEDEPAGIDYPSMSYALLLLFASQIGWHLGAGNPTPAKRLSRDHLEPATQAMLAITKTLPMDELTSAAHHARVLTQSFAEFMQRYDAMLTPTLAAPPVRIGELALKRSEELQIAVLTRVHSAALIRKAAKDISARMFDWIPYTPVFNLTGQPAMNVPLYWTQAGLPVGVQFAGRWNEEATLFALAAQLERSRPWRDRRPAVWSGTLQ